MKNIFFLVFLVSCFFLSVNAQVVYTNFEDFKTAASNAQPGDEIILANGTYNAESIKLENVKGTEEDLVIIRAEEVGGVILNDEAFFDLRHSSYVTIQGFYINAFEISTVFKIQTCNNIRITQNVIDGIKEPELNDDGDGPNSSVWINLQGLWDDPTGLSNHNRIDRNVFQNKHTLGNMIRIDGTDEKQVSQYDVIEYNHFKNMGPRAENEMEVIRVGWSEMSKSDGFTIIANNLFEECNGDPEIISVKCNKNTIAHNTFRRCQGTLSLRHGNESIVEGNFFFGEGLEGTGGVRIYGSDHKIINNYFEGLTGTIWDAPITLTEGDAEEGNGSLSKHFRIERALIANNTVVNCDYGIEVGYDNNSKYSKPPRDVVLAYNIVSGSKNNLVNYINQPSNFTWIDNVLNATNEAVIARNVTFSTDQVLEIDPELVFDSENNLFFASSNSPTFDEFDPIVDVIIDMEGQTRMAPFNYGADEFSNDAVFYQSLSANDVGVGIVNDTDSLSSVLNIITNNQLEMKVFPNPNAGWFKIKNASNASLRIYDLLGNIHFQGNVEDDKANIKVNLPDGLYIFQIESNQRVSNCKVSIER